MAALKTGLNQSLRLTLNQSLVQALHILRMGGDELERFIRREVQENPILEEVSPEGRVVRRSTSAGLLDALAAGTPIPGESGSFMNLHEPVRETVNFDEFTAAPGPTLKEHLSAQAGEAALTEEDRELMTVIISLLDDRGILPDDPTALAAEFGYHPDQVAWAIKTIQAFDPPGCGSPDIPSALMVQASFEFPDDPVVGSILKEHYAAFSRFDFEKIARAMKIDLNRVIDAAEKIKGLRPYPAFGFADGATRYIAPDLFAEIHGGIVSVRLNEERYPRIQINSFYKTVLRKKSIEKNMREFIQDKIASARGLIASLASRRDTLLTVATVIMERQSEYLERGPGFIKPLTQQAVADHTGMNVSTVSRAVNGKYVQTRWGISELRDFFPSKTVSGGREVSSDELQRRIRDIIEGEPAGAPLADQDIVGILGGAGFAAARRTVAKYRDALGIPPAHIRKKIYSIQKTKGTL